MPSRNPLDRPRGGHRRNRLAADAITAQRTYLMEEIARLCDEHDWPGEFLEKARTLLTMHWGRATWSARKGLLESASWLIEIERRRGEASAPQTVAAYRS